MESEDLIWKYRSDTEVKPKKVGIDWFTGGKKTARSSTGDCTQTLSVSKVTLSYF